MSKKRLLKEKRDCEAAGIPLFSLTGDLYSAHTMLIGPADTPYEDGVYFLSFQYPKDYPFKPPKVRFLTPIYHPNVNSNGGTSLDILYDQWSPVLVFPKVLKCFEELLRSPNADSPLDLEAAQLYKEDRAKYNLKVEEMKRKYAI